MIREPEPELMMDEAQARAYAKADFDEPHSRFVELFTQFFPGESPTGYVLDLGCGPADICVRLARAYPNCLIHGVDGSEAMLRWGQSRLLEEQLQQRIQLFRFHLPAAELPLDQYDIIISNSLLHHLGDPQTLWDSVQQFSPSAAPVFVMDLMRPPSATDARRLVNTYASNEPEVLQRDFYQSLVSAYQTDEVEYQLGAAGLKHFSMAVVSDRHWVVYGRTL